MASQSPLLTHSQETVLFGAALCCLVLLMLPSFGLVRPRGEVLANESRRMAPFPSLATRDDWNTFPEALEAYFADRFAFRQALTTVHHRLLVKLFHRSPSPKVLLADDGWLFLQGPQGNAIDLYYRNVKPFTAQEIKGIHEEMTRRRKWVESWGGKALFVMIPEKESIYPEHLPSIFQRPANPETRYDQWQEIVARDPALSHLDLRPTLRDGKGQGLLYFRGDSHWNSDGAYIGYRELVTSLRKWFPMVSSVAEPKKTSPKPYQGDLARMLAVGDWFDEIDLSGHSDAQDGTAPQCAKAVSASTGGVPMPEKSEPVVYECANPALPTAVLIRDSMADHWLPWLPDNFRRLVVMFNWFPAARVIEQERPDVVIFENVERTIEQYLHVTLEIDPVTKRPTFPWER